MNDVLYENRIVPVLNVNFIVFEGNMFRKTCEGSHRSKNDWPAYCLKLLLDMNRKWPNY